MASTEDPKPDQKEVHITDSISAHEKIKVQKWPGEKKGKPDEELEFGDSLFVAEGRWVHRQRRFDHAGNYYDEVVTDPETGDVIHEQHEPLSEHRDHGSAKRKHQTGGGDSGAGDELPGGEE